jgi:hypothetical protein
VGFPAISGIARKKKGSGACKPAIIKPINNKRGYLFADASTEIQVKNSEPRGARDDLLNPFLDEAGAAKKEAPFEPAPGRFESLRVFLVEI